MLCTDRYIIHVQDILGKVLSSKYIIISIDN